MRMEFTAVFQEAPEGGYVAFALEMPGAASQGETLEEARENLEDAIRLLIEARRDRFEREHAGQPLIRQPLVIDEAA